MSLGPEFGTILDTGNQIRSLAQSAATPEERAIDNPAAWKATGPCASALPHQYGLDVYSGHHLHHASLHVHIFMIGYLLLYVCQHDKRLVQHY